MKQLLKKILSKILRFKFRNLVVLVGTRQKFYKSTSIRKDRDSKIILHDHVRIMGAIQCKYGGIVEIGEWSQLGHYSKIMCCDKVVVGPYTAIAQNVTICDNNNHPVSPAYRRKMQVTPEGSDLRSWRHAEHKSIIIGENVWIGEHSRICKGVTIGNNSIVAANSVVTKDVPPNSIAAGNPAKIVKTDIYLQDEVTSTKP